MAYPPQGIDGILTRQDLANFIQQTVNVPPNLQGTLAELLKLRTVRGIVKADGTPDAGEGFDSVQNATGDYTITFIPPFSEPPSVPAPEIVDAVNFRTCKLAADPDESTANIQIFNSAGSLTDNKFHFVAVGPR